MGKLADLSLVWRETLVCAIKVKAQAESHAESRAYNSSTLHVHLVLRE